MCLDACFRCAGSARQPQRVVSVRKVRVARLCCYASAIHVPFSILRAACGNGLLVSLGLTNAPLREPAALAPVAVGFSLLNALSSAANNRCACP